MDSEITEVYRHNFEKELARCVSYADTHKYIGIDTEFPGFVFKQNELESSYYAGVKQNVDHLKLIQIGITLSDSYTHHTWQFNMNFNIDTDKYAQDSIILLKNSGINFERLAREGIDAMEFAEQFITSGLALDDSFTWICFHGGYDFAYMIKILHNKELPYQDKDFLSLVELYFPTYYDIRHMVRNNEIFKKMSLTILADQLKINRVGIQHQAGSDALVTAQVFFKLTSLSNNDNIGKEKNQLFSLADADIVNPTYNSYVPHNTMKPYNTMYDKGNYGVYGMGTNQMNKQYYGQNMMFNMYNNNMYGKNQYYMQ